MLWDKVSFLTFTAWNLWDERQRNCWAPALWVVKLYSLASFFLTPAAFWKNFALLCGSWSKRGGCRFDYRTIRQGGCECFLHNKMHWRREGKLDLHGFTCGQPSTSGPKSSSHGSLHKGSFSCVTSEAEGAGYRLCHGNHFPLPGAQPKWGRDRDQALGPKTLIFQSKKGGSMRLKPKDVNLFGFQSFPIFRVVFP